VTFACGSGEPLAVTVTVAVVVPPSVESCAEPSESVAVSVPATGVTVDSTAPVSPASKQVVSEGQLTARKVTSVPVPSALQSLPESTVATTVPLSPAAAQIAVDAQETPYRSSPTPELRAVADQ